MTVIRLRRRQNPAYRFSRFYHHMEESYRLSQRLKLLQTAGGAALILAGVFLAWCGREVLRLPSLDTRPQAAGAPPPALVDPAPVKWQAAVFQKIPGTAPAFAGEFSRRYRLAGTFFAIGEHQQSRKAIIDDLQISGPENQKLVGEGDTLGDAGVLVAAIQTDYVLLRAGLREEKIWLSFAGGPSAAALQAAPADPGAAAGADMLARFGARVEDRRWLLKRDALLEYYQELMADTERLGKVFESLKPVYQDSRIAGYVLDVEGEKEMFHAFGLRQNDVVRKVNSMPMTSQRRAEYFISEFIKNRVNGFVLDIERDGKPQKFVYLIR